MVILLMEVVLIHSKQLMVLLELNLNGNGAKNVVDFGFLMMEEIDVLLEAVMSKKVVEIINLLLPNFGKSTSPNIQTVHFFFGLKMN